MSYTRITDAAALAAFTVEDPESGEPVSVIAPDETLLQLDSGHFVAASCSAYRQEHVSGRTLTGMVRWLSDSGDEQLDAFGRRILVTMMHTASAEQIETYGEGALRRELLLMLLGEPPTLVNGEPILVWADEVRSSVNIRNAISAGSNEGPAYDLDDLL